MKYSVNYYYKVYRKLVDYVKNSYTYANFSDDTRISDHGSTSVFMTCRANDMAYICILCRITFDSPEHTYGVTVSVYDKDRRTIFRGVTREKDKSTIDIESFKKAVDSLGYDYE